MKQTAETLCANNERTFNRYMMHKFKFAMFFSLHCALYGSMQCNEFIELNADCEFQVLIFHSFDMQKNAIGQTSN